MWLIEHDDPPERYRTAALGQHPRLESGSPRDDGANMFERLKADASHADSWRGHSCQMGDNDLQV